ncbi:MAG: LCP family protein [Actinomycetes bacterium]
MPDQPTDTTSRAVRTPRSEDDAPPMRRSRRSAGRRTQQRRRRRRRAALRTAGGTLALVVLGAAVVGGIGALVAREVVDRDEPVASDAPAVPAGADPQPTLVLATFDQDDPSAPATQVTVLAVDRESGEATVLLVPVTTVVEIPGFGLLQLGQAFEFGEGPLLDATLDNLLGVDLDGVAALSRQDWASLFSRVGGLTVELEERLVERREDGSGVARFEPGRQVLDGPRVAELLTFRSADEQELEALPRVQLVLDTLLDAVAADPGVLEAVFDDGAPMVGLSAGDLEPEDVRALLAALARARQDDRLVTRTLPVVPIGTGDEASYRIDRDRADALVAERLAASVPVRDGAAPRTLEIRNGNGVPGIGQDVAQRLIPLGFSVVLTGNADRFDHPTTRILVYRDDEATRRAAEDVRDALGMGRIELSEVPQGVADMTILVGRDYAAD